MKARKQSSTSYPILFLMIDSTDHITGKTGLSPTVTISKNGGAFGAPSGAVSELASGWYALAGNATDRNTLGPLLIHATAAGADPLDDQYAIVAFDPFDANLGLTNLDAAVSTRLAAAGYTAPPTAAAIADAVWDEDIDPAHNIAGAAGGYMTNLNMDILSGATTAAGLVWDEALADHQDVGSVGEALGDASAPTAGEVADAVWDEAIAGHVAAGSTGAKLNSLTPGSGEAGAGAVETDITVTDGTDPIDGVEVWVTTDAEGSNVVASAVSNALGVATVWLDAGDYYVWMKRSGFNFVNPSALTVS